MTSLEGKTKLKQKHMAWQMHHSSRDSSKIKTGVTDKRRRGLKMAVNKSIDQECQRSSFESLSYFQESFKSWNYQHQAPSMECHAVKFYHQVFYSYRGNTQTHTHKPTTITSAHARVNRVHHNQHTNTVLKHMYSIRT